eukprot:COSAG02_NODE_67064_length_254_cov_0.496774_1_plen_66_part_01
MCNLSGTCALATTVPAPGLPPHVLRDVSRQPSRLAGYIDDLPTVSATRYAVSQRDWESRRDATGHA